MTVRRGDFDKKMPIANISKIYAVKINAVFAHHWTHGNIAEWFKVGDDLIFLNGSGGHDSFLG